MARDAPRSPDRTRTLLGLAAVGLGAIILRFGGVFSGEPRARVLLTVGAMVVGVGCALVSAEARERALSAGTVRASASSTIVPLVIAGAASAGLMMGGL